MAQFYKGVSEFYIFWDFIGQKIVEQELSVISSFLVATIKSPTELKQVSACSTTGPSFITLSAKFLFAYTEYLLLLVNFISLRPYSGTPSSFFPVLIAMQRESWFMVGDAKRSKNIFILEISLFD